MTYAHSDTARAVLRSLVPVICPPEAEPYGDAIVEHMALTFGALPALVQRAVATAIATYDAGALLRYGKRARSLSGDQAEAYYVSWEHGITPLHVQFARALNQIMSLSCYEQPEMMAKVGFAPAPWIDKVRTKRLTVHAADAKAQEARVLAPDPLPRRHA